MARPRVFISSTFYNLKEVRAALEEFVRQMGYDAVVTDNITYLPGQPLDESCYLEAGSCDIFVLIVGGRYGSAASRKDRAKKEEGKQEKEEKNFYDQYKSITRREFESALERDVPIYVAVDRAVNVEYGTWDMNRDNESVKYRHVDSVNVFRLIEFIRNKTQTPVHEFEHSAEILAWLREQWSGLFQKMLSLRSEQKRLASLEAQVGELREVSTTFKRYLETMMTGTAEKEAPEIIAEEDKRLLDAKLQQLYWVQALLNLTEVEVTLDQLINMISEATSLDHLAHLQTAAVPVFGQTPEELLAWWRDDPSQPEEWNEVRSILGLAPLGFESTGDGRRANPGP